MFKIDDSTIHCSRGDGGTIILKIPITDAKGNIKYKDESENIYWCNMKSKILYDSSYIESNVSLDTLSMVLYIFQPNDKITFNIYNKNGYNKDPLMIKEVSVTKITDSVYISLSEAETTFCDPINKPTIFWYDITLNDSMTVICYNEDGAKEFILYPAKGDDELQEFQGITEEQGSEDEDSEDNDYNSIEIIDNLESTSIYAALSANQGRILQEEIESLNQMQTNIKKTMVEDVSSSSENIDNINKTEFRYTLDTTRTPNGANGYLFTQKMDDNYIIQEFTAFDGIRKWIRAKTEGEWAAWNILDATLTATVDLENSWEPHASYPMQIVRYGNIVNIVFIVKLGTSTSIATLPSGFRPKQNLFVPATNLNNNSGTVVRIDTEGKVLCEEGDIGGLLTVNATFLAE